MVKHGKQLQKYMGKLKRITINRPFPSCPYIDGFIHDMSPELVLIQKFFDFHNNGYILLNISDISSLKSNESNKLFDRIMIKAGLMEQIKYDKAVPINNIIETLLFFKKTKEMIIIECEFRKRDQVIFSLGKVDRICKVKGRDTVYFSAIDSKGKWIKKKEKIQIRTISNIQFRTPYTDYFSRYVK